MGRSSQVYSRSTRAPALKDVSGGSTSRQTHLISDEWGSVEESVGAYLHLGLN